MPASDGGLDEGVKEANDCAGKAPWGKSFSRGPGTGVLCWISGGCDINDGIGGVGPRVICCAGDIFGLFWFCVVCMVGYLCLSKSKQTWDVKLHEEEARARLYTAPTT